MYRFVSVGTDMAYLLIWWMLSDFRDWHFVGWFTRFSWCRRPWHYIHRTRCILELALLYNVGNGVYNISKMFYGHRHLKRRGERVRRSSVECVKQRKRWVTCFTSPRNHWRGKLKKRIISALIHGYGCVNARHKNHLVPQKMPTNECYLEIFSVADPPEGTLLQINPSFSSRNLM